jgi:outer membrane protein TolC
MPLTQGDLRAAAATRSANLIADNQDPVTGPIGLHEAMARAIKYNLDHRIETSSVVLALASKRLVDLDMLPDLVVNSEFSRRSNTPGGSSVNAATGLTSVSASRSTQRDSFDSDLTLSWDVLDFGLSYYRSQQSANEVLIAMEQRRATVNRLLENVRTAYWRAVSHDRLSGRIAALERKAQRALTQSRSLSRGGFSSPKAGMIYQRDLLRVIGEMKALQRDLEVSKFQLAALMNLEPGQEFTVRIPSRKGLPAVNQPVTQMVQAAYLNRPELREITYEQRNLALDEKSSALRLLPSVRPYLSGNISDNSLLAEQDWLSAGTRISWDLINLFNQPRRAAQLEGRKALLDARALALTHAVATQVHVAHARYTRLRSETQFAAEYASVSRSITQAISDETSAGLAGLQEEVFEELGSVLAELRYDSRYAETQSAYASLYAAIGQNNYPAQMSGSESLKDLEKTIHDIWVIRGESFH